MRKLWRVAYSLELLAPIDWAGFRVGHITHTVPFDKLELDYELQRHSGCILFIVSAEMTGWYTS